MKSDKTEDVGRAWVCGGSCVPEGAQLLKYFGLYFVDLEELQTWFKEITTGSELSFKQIIQRAHGEEIVVFQVRDDESFHLGRDIGDVEVGKDSINRRTWYLDVEGGSGKKN